MFGLGPQSCPGRSMAITEGILILKAFFERLDIEQKDITHNIAVERNALLTIRPVGVTAKVVAAPRRAVERAHDPRHTVCPDRDRTRIDAAAGFDDALQQAAAAPSQ